MNIMKFTYFLMKFENQGLSRDAATDLKGTNSFSSFSIGLCPEKIIFKLPLFIKFLLQIFIPISRLILVSLIIL